MNPPTYLSDKYPSPAWVINTHPQRDNSKEYKIKTSISHIHCLKTYGSYRHKDVDVIDIVTLTHSRIKIVTVPSIYIYEILLYEKMDLTRFKTTRVISKEMHTLATPPN